MAKTTQVTAKFQNGIVRITVPVSVEKGVKIFTFTCEEGKKIKTTIIPRKLLFFDSSASHVRVRVHRAGRTIDDFLISPGTERTGFVATVGVNLFSGLRAQEYEDGDQIELSFMAKDLAVDIETRFLLSACIQPSHKQPYLTPANFGNRN